MLFIKQVWRTITKLYLTPHIPKAGENIAPSYTEKKSYLNALTLQVAGGRNHPSYIFFTVSFLDFFRKP
jgi:hypothetical protein